jgi:8-oxo-dGTP pyrophosphatase MutT (NUDIX family)
MTETEDPQVEQDVTIGSPDVASSSRTRSVRRPADLVLAGGGIVLRQGRSGCWQVAVVHRPSPRNVWSLPKGKLEPDETLEACALREVEEETGLRCCLLGVAGTTEYVDRRGRPKEVTYWMMEVVDGEFSPNEEVDELRWLELAMARRALSYEHDRRLLTLLDTLSLARSG